MKRRSKKSIDAALRRKWAVDGTYERLGEAQNWRCGICGKPLEETVKDGSGRRFDIDHRHSQTVPRGLLCRLDNRRLREWMDETWLRQAANYLKHHDQT